MKIVFQKVPQWEHKPNAENELSSRLLLAVESISGVEAISSSNVAAISSFSPDIILPLHFFLPKLFDAFTIGCMWNPTYALEENDAWDNIRSYDGYGVASEKQKELVAALKFNSPSSYFTAPIYPSTNKTVFQPPTTLENAAYIGSNWDRRRHGELLLATSSVMILGPKESWQQLKEKGLNYGGEVPFDGKTVLEAYRRSGIGLALHHSAHNDEGIPCMRPFEIAASGAVMIADQNPFVLNVFGDNALYIDSTLDGESMAEQIDMHVAWIKNHPGQAQEMARECNRIFNTNYALEVLLDNLLQELESYSVKQRKRMVQDPPAVEILIRTDGNQKEKLFRAIESINKQSYPNVRARIIYRGGQSLLDNLKVEVLDNFPTLTVNYCEVYQSPDRGTQFYTGLKEAKADFVGFLDHDDILFSDHVGNLMKILLENKEIALAYSGSVRVWEEGIPPGDEDQRKLAFFYGLNDETGLKSVIVSNSYIVRRDSIPSHLLFQPIPKIDSKEDYIFLELLKDAGKRFKFSEKVTCAFYWRSSKEDNSAFNIRDNKRGQSVRELILKPMRTTMGYAQSKVRESPQPQGFKQRLASLFGSIKHK
jgi:spore maturation protein CgeB